MAEQYLPFLSDSGKGRKGKKKAQYALPSSDTFPVATSSPESFQKLLSQLGSVQRGKFGLAALGQEANAKPREGLLSKLIGQEKGILTAPFRFVTALASDVLNLPVSDDTAQEAMQKYNAFESAIRSARGEFAVTGGDIFKVNDDDDFLERLGKYAGALAFDFTLDPINWFGGAGIVGRKGGAILLAREGERMLPALTTAMAEEGLQSTKLIDDLFNSSKAVQAVKAGDRDLAVRLGIGEGLSLNETEKLRVAGQELAGYVGEVFYKEGRSGLRKAIVDLTGSETVADKFFKSLPGEMAGGLFVKNPITGKPFKVATKDGTPVPFRIAGGTGRVLPGLEKPVQLLNQGRFVMAASTPARFLSDHFNTTIGPVWSQVKKGMIGGVPLGKNDRTKLYEFTAFKDALRKQKVDIFNLGRESSSILSSVTGAKNALGNETDKAAYEAGLITHFHAPEASISDTATEVTKAGAEAAQRLHNLKNLRYQQMVEAGLDVGMISPTQVPLRYTPEHKAWLASQGTDIGTDAYSMSQGRTRELRYISDPEAAKKAGYSLPLNPNVVALTGPELNRIYGLHPAGHKIFLEDPVMIMADYLESTGRTLAAKRFADSLRASNVIFNIPDAVRNVLKERETATLIGAMADVPKALRSKWKAVRDNNEKKLKELVDEADKAGVITTERYRAASAALTSAETNVTEAQKALVAANARVRELRPQARQIQDDLESFVESQAMQGDEEARRVLRNAKSRKTKADTNLRKANQDIDDAVELTALAEEIGTEADVAEAVAARDLAEDVAQRRAAKVEQEFFNVEELAAEAREARAFREQITGQITENRIQLLRAFEEALNIRVQAAEVLNQARQVRRAAAREATLALKDTSVARASTLEGLLEQYIKATAGFKKIQSELGTSVKNMTDEQLVVYYRAKAVMDITRETLREMLGYSTRKDAQALGPNLYRKIIQFANEASEDEFIAMRVFANADKLEEFTRQLDNVDINAHMPLVGDMFSSYKQIRRFMSVKEIEEYGKLEGVVFAKSQLRQLTRLSEDGGSAFLRSEKRPSEAVSKLYNDAGFARIGSGENKGHVRIPLPLKDMYAAKGVRGVLEDIYTLHDNPGDWQKFVKNLYDPLALVWKTGATAARGPAFVLNNVVGGITNNYLFGVSVRDHAIAAKATATVINATRDVRRRNPNKSYVELLDEVESEIAKRLDGITVNGRKVSDLLVEFLEQGGHFGTDTAWQLQELQRLGLTTSKPITKAKSFTAQYEGEASNRAERGYRKLAGMFLDNRVQRMFNDWSQSSEVFLRFAAYVNGWRRFGSMESAMDVVYMLHFDYQDVSQAELWVKRFIPFYTWNRNNIPLQLRTMFLAPDKMRKLYAANEEAKAAFGVDGDAAWLDDYMPDWLSIQSGFISDLKIGGNHLALFPKIPLFDVDRMFGVGYIGSMPIIVPRMSEFINLTGPVIKSPVEFLTGRNFERGYEYDTVADLLMAQGRNIFPYAGTAKRLLSVAGLPVEKEKRVSNLINVLLGTPYGAATITEKTLMGEAIRDSAKISAQLKKASVEAGVDYEWLVKQIQQGKNLQQIVAMISGGQGSIERQEQLRKIKASQKKTFSRDYEGIIRGLESGQLITGF